MARGFSHGGRGGGGMSSSGGGGARGFSGGSSGFSSSRRSSSFGGEPRRSRGGFGGGPSHYHHDPGPHHHRPRRPWRVPMFGRTVVITSGVRAGMMFLIFFLVFGIFMLSSSISSIGYRKDDVKDQEALILKYEQYDVKFKDVISKAQSGNYENYKIVTGTYKNRTFVSYGSDPTTTGVYQAVWNNGAYYYFIVYEYTSVDGSVKVDSTFTQFLYQDVIDSSSASTDKTIEIACAKIGSEYWAINTDYSLESNQDYLYEKEYLTKLEASYKHAKSYVFIAVLFVVGSVLVLALILVRQYKKAKKEAEVEDAKNEAEIAEARAKAEVAEAEANQVGRVCRHCGSDIPKGASRCPNCGSTSFEKD